MCNRLDANEGVVASKHVTVRVGFDEEIGPAPVNGVFVVRANTLKMTRIDTFTLSGVKRICSENRESTEEQGEQKKFFI